MAFDKESAKQDRSLLAAALASAGAVHTEKRTIKCPFHEDKHPSAEIKESPAGNWNFYCYVCSISDDVFGIRARIEGRDVGEILKEDFPRDPAGNGHGPAPARRRTLQPIRPAETAKEKPSYATFDDSMAALKSWHQQIVIEETNRYTVPDPSIDDFDYAVIRYRSRPGEKKQFMPMHRGPDGRWRWKHPDVLPLLHRRGILKAPNVLMVEGEKNARAFMRELKWPENELTVTTCPRGFEGPRHTDLSPLAGKTVYLWRDNDDPGLRWEETLVEKMLELDPPCLIGRVRVEDLGLNLKDDLVDFLELFPGTPDQRREVVAATLEASEIVSASAPLYEHFQAIRDGKIKNLPFPNMPVLSHLGKILIPGMLTTLCGDPGARKSFLMIEWFWRWIIEAKLKAKLMMLEDTNVIHLKRALAQMCGNKDIVDIDQHSLDPDKMDGILAQYAEPIEIFARHLRVMGSKPVSLDEIAEWIEEQCEAGIELIGVDPITAATTTKDPWQADYTFVMKVKAIAERTGARIILVTHPRGGNAKPGLASMAGGLAYPRFSQGSLWLQRFDEMQTGRVYAASESADYTLQEKYRHVLQIQKARHGPGQGKHIAVDFDYNALTFRELGLIKVGE